MSLFEELLDEEPMQLAMVHAVCRRFPVKLVIQKNVKLVIHHRVGNMHLLLVDMADYDRMLQAEVVSSLSYCSIMVISIKDCPRT